MHDYLSVISYQLSVISYQLSGSSGFCVETRSIPIVSSAK
ncbi:hypothetical protein VL20_3582 [Microcystis panniformis FACHB-1757]|uniref:Uncharacterized protein n=1 Tax=Microcystis panniformis FACHB-1757 TaxID=1638788 RepID=A0A0K1S3J4_9CHRO|nr:hypothetical protein VL20_3582 [Microcystis panniformis FACHB-1757]